MPRARSPGLAPCSPSSSGTRCATASSPSRTRTSASSREPSSARSHSAAAIVTPTSTSRSPCPTASRSWTCSTTGRARSPRTSAPCTSSTSNVRRRSTASFCCLTRSSSTSRSRRPQFRPASPRFRLLFGETAPGEPQFAPAARSRGSLRLGRHLRAPLAVVHRARASLAGGALHRRRTRPRAVARVPPGRDSPAVQARGYDDLPAELLAGFEDTHVRELEPRALRSVARRRGAGELLREGDAANLPAHG